jgi:hypothetical protein
MSTLTWQGVYAVTPSRILKIYYGVTFAVGLVLSLPMAHWVTTQEVGVRGGILMTVSWNILFVMLLPMIMDWAEHHYFKARFLQIEEIASKNPELAAVIKEQCTRLHIAGCRFAVVESGPNELFSYGVWGRNPRLVVSESQLSQAEQTKMIPSIEAELQKFRKTEPTKVFIAFAVVQLLVQYAFMAVLK